MIVCINGKFIDAEAAKISVFDHGLLYGDGVFDTMVAVNYHIFWLEEHIDRLIEGCKLARINLRWTKKELTTLCENTYRKTQEKDGRIRVTITRGVGEVPIQYSKSCKPNLIIFSSKLILPPEDVFKTGFKLATCTMHQRFYPQIKNLSFMPSVMAYLDADEKGFNEALFVNEKGNVLEGSTFNVFGVKNGKIFTSNEDILWGVTRAKVIELIKKHGMKVEERPVSLKEILDADEVFATGSTKKALPIVQIDKTKIGDSKPGKITKKIIEAFATDYF